MSEFVLERKRLDADFGYLDVWGVAAIVGPMDYSGVPGIDAIAYVPRETLADSCSDLVGCPITVGHPVTDDGMVTTATAQQLTHGCVVAAAMRGDELCVHLRVWNQAAIDTIQAGDAVELSPGYLVTLAESDLYEGAALVQTRRYYNHLAIVEAARGGSTVRLLTDGKMLGKRKVRVADGSMGKGKAKAKDMEEGKEEAQDMEEGEEVEAADATIDEQVAELHAMVSEIRDMLTALMEPAEPAAEDEDLPAEDEDEELPAEDEEEDGKKPASDGRRHTVRLDVDTIARAAVIASKHGIKTVRPSQAVYAVAKHFLGDAMPKRPTAEFLRGAVASILEADAAKGSSNTLRSVARSSVVDSPDQISVETAWLNRHTR